MKVQVIAAAIFLAIIGGIGFGGYKVIKQMSGRSNPASQSTAPAFTLSDYVEKPTSQVRLTTEGAVTAAENHVSQTITISASTRTIQVFKGYSSAPALSQDYPNSQAAYADFIYALQYAGFTKNTPNPKAAKNEIGLCPQGQRFIYELIDGPATDQRLWSTSCGDITTFKGSGSLVQTLFRAQIPDYTKLPPDMRVH